MNAAGYVLACALLETSALPLSHRAAWAALLRHCEPHPADAHSAAHILHLSGHLAHAELTPDGVLAAKNELHEVLTPPLLKGGER
ncbi:hypothetical protein [Deinococcus sp.]|uniref:hypothetical protein n=1 Tax=Deinococcus sp. TaxID=47478 RepID=UPI003B5A7786